MRRNPARRTNGFLGGRELLRLLSLVFMLVIIGMTIFRFRDSPQTARLAANAPAANVATDADAELTAQADTEPETENPAEHAALANEVQAVMDMSTAIHPVEMPAYNRLLRWTEELTPAAEKRAAEITFHDLVKKPNENRGRLLHVRLRVRRVQSYEVPADDAEKARTVYELWGWPVAADGWLYVVITPELPKGFPTAGEVDQSVDVYGYFLKLQGYHPAESKPNARPLAAPLVMGRIEWQPTAVVQRNRPVSPIVIGAFGLMVVTVATYWLWPRKKAALRAGSTDLGDLPAGFDSIIETDEESYSHDAFAEEDDDSQFPASDSGFEGRR